jgi:uncharacterized protein YndB with AHSA1/START domain
MVTSSESVSIARPPAEVFQYVADLGNEPTWHVDVASVPSDTDLRSAVQAVPRQTDGTVTVLEVESGARVVYRADFAGLQLRIV